MICTSSPKKNLVILEQSPAVICQDHKRKNLIKTATFMAKKPKKEERPSNPAMGINAIAGLVIGVKELRRPIKAVVSQQSKDQPDQFSGS
jgi:hypothetical protein